MLIEKKKKIEFFIRCSYKEFEFFFNLNLHTVGYIIISHVCMHVVCYKERALNINDRLYVNLRLTSVRQSDDRIDEKLSPSDIYRIDYE